MKVVLIIAITFFGCYFTEEYFSKEKKKDRIKLYQNIITSLKEVNPNFKTIK